MFKIVLAMVWLLVIARNITMGVAWHRFTAWFNIWFKREGSGRTALGALKPLTVDGKAVTLEDIEEDRIDEDAILGVGSIEDFSWKGILDFTTCTECGRCQSQCPAWNTEKPLSPKLMIMGLRDAAYAKAPYLQTPEDERAGLSDTLVKEGERPLVADTGDDWFYMPENGSAVIDPDVLWSCTSCGACVQQCPVDIEHVDHIVDMRRYAVLVESNFPAELNGLFKGLENKGNPWNMSPNARMDWAKGLDFEVKVVGETIESLDEVDWLFWVGCAGAYEDRAKKTTRAVAELLDIAGVSFGVLGNGETCTGDPARRAGNEFVFQGLAQQNAETFKEYKVKKVVSTCAHCFNTLKNEYQEFGVELEVVHHTQLLNRLVREGKLTPVGGRRGRPQALDHLPRPVLHRPPQRRLHAAARAARDPARRRVRRDGAQLREVLLLRRRRRPDVDGGEHRRADQRQPHQGGRRHRRRPDRGRLPLLPGDALRRSHRPAGQGRGARGGRDPRRRADAARLRQGRDGDEARARRCCASAAAPEAKAAPVETKAEPEAGDETITEDTVVETADAGPAAKASGGSSLFDTPAEDESPPRPRTSRPRPRGRGTGEGRSVRRLALRPRRRRRAAPSRAAEPEPEPEPEAKAATTPASTGGSLFDIAADEPAAAAAAREDPGPGARGEGEARSNDRAGVERVALRHRRRRARAGRQARTRPPSLSP